MSKKPYYHLTFEQRCQIYTLRSNGKLQSEIAIYTKFHFLFSTGKCNFIDIRNDCFGSLYRCL
jgi:hypothetical protein